MSQRIIRISVVEDLPEIRESLRNKINRTEGMICVSDFDNGEAALEGLVNDQPDIVIMDIGLPNMKGPECMLRVKLKCSDMLFIMFTVFDHDEKVFESLKAGADGYMLKKEGPRRAIEAIKELAEGGSPMSGEIARKVMKSFHQLGNQSGKEKLTSRQTQILQLLSQGLLYKEIADQLNPPITVGGLKQNINRIYKKLQVNNRTEAINKFLGNAY